MAVQKGSVFRSASILNADSCAQHNRILGEVIKAGATTLNIPDTTGWNLPHEFGGLIAAIKANTPGIDSEWRMYWLVSAVATRVVVQGCGSWVRVSRGGASSLGLQISAM